MMQLGLKWCTAVWGATLSALCGASDVVTQHGIGRTPHFPAEIRVGTAGDALSTVLRPGSGGAILHSGIEMVICRVSYEVDL
jgi:hypothetical protein